MFSYSLPFPKVSVKNIDYGGENLGDSDIAHMISNKVSHALKGKWTTNVLQSGR